MQDVILLCELIENRFQIMQEKFGFNPRKINSASTLSGCVQRDLSKVVIALPTCYEHAEVFEKSLIGGFSCVNTRIGFDSEVLLPSYTKQEYAKMNIDQAFRAYKNQNFKLGYKLKLPWDNWYEDYRIISKILKFDENNQYGHAMTKPMPVGGITDKVPNWLEFNLLLEKVDLDDERGHLFLVDIEFDHKKASPRQIMYNEIFPPIVEKKKILEANERSVFQLFELYSTTQKENPKSYKLSAQSLATLFPKRYIPLYLEEIKFLITRCGWRVTKLYRHFYFEQKRFKRDFILMNQKSRQESNHSSVFNDEVSQFVNPQTLKEEILAKYNSKMGKLLTDDPFYSAKADVIQNSKAANEEVLKSFERRAIKQKRKMTFKNYQDRIADANISENVKTIINFSHQDTASIKALGIKKKRLR